MQNTQNWKKYLPSSHFVTIVVGVAILIGVVFGIRAIVRHFQKKQFVIKTGLETNIKVGDLLTIDSDNDGVSDWEESLWGLDPKKSDTNDDGVSDGTEVQAKKAELKASTEPTTGTEELNETARLARDLFTTITALSQNGLLTDSSIINIAGTLGDQITTKDIPDVFSQKDLTIVPTSKNSIQVYQKSLAKVILKYPTDKIGTELEVIAEIFNTNDMSKLADLKEIADQYESLSNDLHILSVPADLADKHTTIINTAHRLSVSLTDISKTFENPVASLGGFITYTKESVVFMNTLESVNTYFQKNGILQ